MTTSGALFLSLLVAIVASILMRERRSRPRKPRLDVLSEHCADSEFRDQRLAEEARARR